MMKTSNRIPRSRPLRGKNLDKALEETLEVMKNSGKRITTANVARHLKLGSRTTLYTKSRKDQINRARVEQKNAAIETNARSSGARQESATLKKQLNDLQGILITVSINAYQMGLDAEKLFDLKDIKKSGDDLFDAEITAKKWLGKVGLLKPLDPNVRRMPQ